MAVRERSRVAIVLLAIALMIVAAVVFSGVRGLVLLARESGPQESRMGSDHDLDAIVCGRFRTVGPITDEIRADGTVAADSPIRGMFGWPVTAPPSEPAVARAYEDVRELVLRADRAPSPLSEREGRSVRVLDRWIHTCVPAR